MKKNDYDYELNEGYILCPHCEEKIEEPEDLIYKEQEREEYECPNCEEKFLLTIEATFKFSSFIKDCEECKSEKTYSKCYGCKSFSCFGCGGFCCKCKKEKKCCEISDYHSKCNKCNASVCGHCSKECIHCEQDFCEKHYKSCYLCSVSLCKNCAEKENHTNLFEFKKYSLCKPCKEELHVKNTR